MPSDLLIQPKHAPNGTYEVGCDEAGRGCLAGPVAAAAVVLPSQFDHPLVRDSKTLTERQRTLAREIIERHALAYRVILLPPRVIDALNILHASILAMQMAVDALPLQPSNILVDGNYFHPIGAIPHQCIVKGDAKYLSIAAASILAKTHRDDYMLSAHFHYPHYAWNKNKGYPTAAHRKAIQEHGLSPLHRFSFRTR